MPAVLGVWESGWACPSLRSHAKSSGSFRKAMVIEGRLTESPDTSRVSKYTQF